MNEIRISPDHKSVGIKSDHPDDSPFGGWSVIHSTYGGHHGTPLSVESWQPVAADTHEPTADDKVRVSPDGKAVAIRSDHPEGTPAAGWGIAFASDVEGQGWRPDDYVGEWYGLTLPPMPEPAASDASAYAVESTAEQAALGAGTHPTEGEHYATEAPGFDHAEG